MRTLIVEDHFMFREMLAKLCRERLGHELVREAGNGLDALALFHEAPPEFVLLDLNLPGLDGFSLIDQMRAATPAVRILVLSSRCDDFTVYRCEKLRVNGFVDKNTNSISAVSEAVAAIGEGRVFFSQTFQRIRAARQANPRSFDKLLTDREQGVLALLAAPMSDREIAARLGISAETVEKHRFNILRKLDLQTTPELVRFARQCGFSHGPEASESSTLP